MTPTIPTKGRVDLLLLGLAEKFCGLARTEIRNRTGYDVDLWDEGGIRNAVTEAIGEYGIPTEPIDIGMTLARNVFGILPEAPKRRRLPVRSGNLRRRAHGV